jgi:hypothetical protein
MVLTTILCVPIALQLMVITVAIGSSIMDSSIRPRLIPRAEIEQLADDIMRHHPDDPEGAAYAAQCAAWYRSDGFEQGRWRRVRRAIRRRLRRRADRALTRSACA